MSPQKTEKKFVENVGRKKKFVVEIDEKYVDQEKHQMVAYIIGKAYEQKISLTKHKKKLSVIDRQKKDCFLSEVKKKFASTKTLGPPTDIKLCVPNTGSAPELSLQAQLQFRSHVVSPP